MCMSVSQRYQARNSRYYVELWFIGIVLHIYQARMRRLQGMSVPNSVIITEDVEKNQPDVIQGLLDILEAGTESPLATAWIVF